MFRAENDPILDLVRGRRRSGNILIAPE